eukprot:CAMPEP_0115882868 /NCGR_PEP_ID=MMETSP0287-20121206/29238_1 /TAXON_ID=412157 /ORGANISM="Chrysochromulina rotalis, Strain UIO044" /LENGTH=152 /DNA_ID=CAMNT_0003338983 /DNA_START=37 /DNA_END=493 /DNA_ORIENTATION=+
MCVICVMCGHWHSDTRHARPARSRAPSAVPHIRHLAPSRQPNHQKTGRPASRYAAWAYLLSMMQALAASAVRRKGTDDGETAVSYATDKHASLPAEGTRAQAQGGGMPRSKTIERLAVRFESMGLQPSACSFDHEASVAAIATGAASSLVAP